MLKNQREIIITASKSQVWNQVTKALLRSLPLMRLNFNNEFSFSAVLVMKFAGISFPMDVDVLITDMHDDDFLICTINATKLKKFFSISQVAKFELEALEKKKAKIKFEIEVQNLSFIIKFLFSNKINNLTNEVFNAFEMYLQEWNKN